MSLLEAMYAGKAVVATDIIGNGDVIDAGDTGLLANSVDDFIGAIDCLIRDAAFRVTLGKAANAMIVKQYNSQINLLKYDKMYRLLLR